MSKSIKSCADCKYFKISRVDTSRYSKCSNPNLIWQDMIYGEVVYPYADMSRNREYLCGTEAKYFEQKISLFTKLKNKLVSIWRKQ